MKTSLTKNSEKNNTKTKFISKTLEEQILSGKLGQSGEKFYTVRKLASIYGMSPVTALNVFNRLKEKNLIYRYGNHYYLTTGSMEDSSALKKRLSKSNESSQQKLVGIHVPELENPFFSALVNEMSKALNKKGYMHVIMTSNNDCSLESKILDTFIKIGVSGVISCSNLGESLSQYYKSYPLPTVYLGNRFFQDEESFVMVNDDLATKQVAEHLVEMGYRHFMYIGTKDQNDTDKRGLSFINAIQNLGYSVPVENVFRLLDYQQFSVPQSLVKAIKESPKPLGIFCFHDIIAVNVINACQKLSVNIPNDVGVVGFDNLRIAQQCKPPLSSIAYRFDGMANSAVQMLLSKISYSKNNKNVKLDYVNHYLTVRESSRKN